MKEHQTIAAHAHDGEGHHAVATALRVMLSPDSGGWFAQGLEIDYAASGSTIEEAKKNFEDGFCATIHEHLRMYGTIDHFMKVAGAEAWAEFFKGPKDSMKQKFSCVQLHDLTEGGEDCFDTLPFDSIAFITSELKRGKHAADLQPA